MNEPGKLQPKAGDHISGQPKVCEVCSKKDDEDIYIIFNILYRVIIGDVFYQRRRKDDLSLDLELLQEERSKQMTEESKSSEEKLLLFQHELSCEILTEVITSSHFDQLLREIFGSKYRKINETNCNHLELAKHFIESFNVPNFQDIKKEKSPQNIERLNGLLDSIKKLKEDIQKYNAEISRLPNHIMTRLFNSQTHFIKREKSPNQADDIENNLEDLRASKEDEPSHIRNKGLKTSGNGSASSSGANGSNHRSEESTNNDSNGNNDNNGHNQPNGSNGSSNGSSEQSTDTTFNNNNAENKRNRSKALPFKSKLPKKATDVLKAWFLSNISNPYPSHEAKESLSKMTGLTRKQIQNWFTNSRKRFLEPTKKKIEGQKSDGKSPHEMPVIEPPSNVQPTTNVVEPPLPQINTNPPNNQQQNIPIRQIPQFVALPAVSNPQIIRPQGPQRFQISPTQAPNPTLIYQGMPQTGAIPQGSNIVLVPYFVPQPQVTYYRQPDFVPMNPQFIPFPQGNMPTIEQPNMNSTNSVLLQPYFIPLQQNMIDIRPPNQPLPSNFNTINNNVFNNINNLGVPNMGPVAPIGTVGTLGNMVNMGTMPNMGNVGNMIGMGNMINMGNVGGFGNIPNATPITGINQLDPNMVKTLDRPASVGKMGQNDFSNMFEGNINSPTRSLQRNSGGMHHPRPELDELNHQGRKHLHKDHNPENDTN